MGSISVTSGISSSTVNPVSGTDYRVNNIASPRILVMV